MGVPGMPMTSNIFEHFCDSRDEASVAAAEHIAARLEGLAEPGGICISATVHEQVRNTASVGYVDLGDQSVKNIPDLVHVYRVDLHGEPTQTQAVASA